MEFLDRILIDFGLAVDPDQVAGRPDRFVPDNGEEPEMISWGVGKEKYGSSSCGDHWGEWVVAVPPKRIELPEDHPPLPLPAPIENAPIPYREG